MPRETHAAYLIFATFLASTTAGQTIPQEFNYEQDGISDFASNDTRALCVSMLVPALEATNMLPLDPDFSTMAIYAHTARAEGINCFVGFNNLLYHVFFDINGANIEGFVTRYSLDAFSPFNISDE